MCTKLTKNNPKWKKIQSLLPRKKENELKYTTQSPKIMHLSLFMSLNKRKRTNTQECY